MKSQVLGTMLGFLVTLSAACGLDEAIGDVAMLGSAPLAAGMVNVAAASQGAVASASSAHSSGRYPAAGAINGNRSTSDWGQLGGWNDDTLSVWPDWLQVQFDQVYAVEEIDVFTYGPAGEPALSTLAGANGNSAFRVEVWSGGAWQLVPGGNVTGNTKMWRQFVFAPVLTDRVRVVVNAGYRWSRIIELEAWAQPAGDPAPEPPPSANLVGSVDISATGGSLDMRLGDLDGDGRFDLLVVRGPGPYDAAVRALAAYRLDGTELWTWNSMTPFDTPPYWWLGTCANCPVQIADIDGDDFNEIILIDETPSLLILDGRDASLKWGPFALPDPAAKQGLGITNVAGGAYARNILVTDGMNKIWALGGNGRSRIVEIEAWDTAVATNYALASQGSAASASSIYNGGYPASAVINGDRTGAGWGSGGGWNDGINDFDRYPDWVAIDFGATRTIGRVDVFTLQDSYASPAQPTGNMGFSRYGITAFYVEYWNGSAWVELPDTRVTGNNKVWVSLALAAPVSTTKIRVVVTDSALNYENVRWSHSGVIGHYPWWHDFDGDGKDEIMAGHDFLRPDGTRAWTMANVEGPWPSQHHADSLWIGDLDPAAADGLEIVAGLNGQTPSPADCLKPPSPRCEYVDSPGSTVVYDRFGNEKWRYTQMTEGQHVAIGDFRPDVPGREVAVLDRISRTDLGQRGEDGIKVLSSTGALLASEPRRPAGCWISIMETMDTWDSAGTPYILAYRRSCPAGNFPPALYDGKLNKVVAFPTGDLAMHADVCGDANEEVITWTKTSLVVDIYSSQAESDCDLLAPGPGVPLPQPKHLANRTFYTAGGP